METRWVIHSNNSKLYAFIIAILPCIMMYKVPLVEKGAATVAVLFCAIIIFVTLHSIDYHFIKVLFPRLIYLIYIVLRSEGNWIEIILQVSAFIHLYALYSNMMNLSAFKHYVKLISVFAAICVIIQNIFHILINIHQLRITH